jgi:hypothetical protein
MQYFEAVKGLWNTMRDNLVLPNPKLGSVAPPLPIEPGEPKDPRDKKMRKKQIFNMEKILALSEDLCLVVHLDPEALASMQAAKALLQLLPDIVWIDDSRRDG